MPRRIAADPRQPRIDHIADARDREGRLRDVRREHDTRRAPGAKDPLLARAREPRVERQRLVAFRPEARERELRVANPALAGQEHEHVARRRARGAALLRQRSRGGHHTFGKLLFVRERPIQHLDRIAASFDAQDGRSVKVPREPLSVDRCAGDDQLQIRAAWAAADADSRAENRC